jgi:uncharacterized protein
MAVLCSRDSHCDRPPVIRQPRPASTEELRARIAQALPELRQRHPIRTIGVFGSWARGEQTPESDVDLLVTFSEPVGFFAFLELKEELEVLLRVRVDLVTPGGLRPQLEERVSRELLPT